jgi:hypothetical protein
MRAILGTSIALIVLAMCVAPAAAADKPQCHNITGTCFDHGFVCANEEVVPHSQRCNGVEDCADGTDEFMCDHADHRPLHERPVAERRAVQQASCIKCTCAVAVLDIVSGNGWFAYAKEAPTDFLGLMTGSGSYRGKPCNSRCVFNIKMGFYKKNKICRGWLCCARQRECNVCSSTPSPACTSVTQANRCY